MKIIKKEILIDASPEKVWKHVTDPEKIAGWLMPNDFEPTVGREFSMQCPQQGKITCEVKEIVPHQKLVYAFHSQATKVQTLVTILLESEGNRTRVTLTHTGWDKLPPPDQSIADNFDQGWGGFLTKLQEQAKSKENSS
jgi:uncharacterized protein YndB with AHSA1/START domain